MEISPHSFHRPAAVAGMFYPGQAATLANEVAALLASLWEDVNIAVMAGTGAESADRPACRLCLFRADRRQRLRQPGPAARHDPPRGAAGTHPSRRGARLGVA